MTRDAQRADSADRMRRCRARRAAGNLRVVFDLDQASVRRLVELGWLAAQDWRDPAAVAVAAGEALRAAPQREMTLNERIVAAVMAELYCR